MNSRPTVLYSPNPDGAEVGSLAKNKFLMSEAQVGNSPIFLKSTFMVITQMSHAD